MAIQVLSRALSEKIAAGEVVDRPAACVKELVENSTDAGASYIEVEITGSGLRSIRITDNGSGIPEEDVRTAFLRHATGKISKEEDLYSIRTLGFRGEALAAIAAVAKVRMVTRTQDEELATVYSIEGGIEDSFDRIGGDFGTTVTVSDIFYNTPARLKFLKKDQTEGNTIQSLMLQLALSHPGISYKFIRDGKTVFTTPGKGELYSAAFAVLPREITNNLIEVKSAANQYGITVSGYIGKPEISRKSRVFQFAFVNRRYVKSATITAAVEQAYRNMNLSSGFPVFILNLSVPYDAVDVNVHPAKTEVRFANEHEVFLNVHRSVANTLASLTMGPFGGSVSVAGVSEGTESSSQSNEGLLTNLTNRTSLPFQKIRESPLRNPDRGAGFWITMDAAGSPRDTAPGYPSVSKENESPVNETVFQDDIRVIGELFTLYILAEYKDSFIIIDKHAAHERILFEEFKDINLSDTKQILLEPEIVTVSSEEKSAIIGNTGVFSNLGFSVEDFGEYEVAVREVPVFFTGKRTGDAVLQIAQELIAGNDDPATTEGIRLLKSISCRAAVKAGHKTPDRALLEITRKILFGEIPGYCPHGRNVYVLISKEEIDKRFGR